MESSPTARNRLDEEESPYLRQHADNPVNWQPWDEAALAAARERDVPIFLSIGYSACHWCHVMEEESFADREVADALNEDFVPIKVDREERPDVDSIYMTVCQLVTGRGGWPLSAWLTPEGKPFYVGTYFPRESRQGTPGFLELLADIDRSWKQDREEVENRAQQWTEAARDRLEETPGADVAGGEPPTSDLLESAAEAALRSADRDHGGFSPGGPKFPQPARIRALFRAADRTGRDPFEQVGLEALDAMAAGGLYDHVGGGFHRYCVDADWTVPHFEKMLYDNAEIPRAFLEGYRLTGDERYAEIVRESLGFVEREMSHDSGGFYSTLDAESEGAGGERKEGAFYVWTPETVGEAIEDDLEADLACARYGITESGNFEGETVLTIARSVEELGEEFDLAPAAVEERLESARQTLFLARENRPRPPRDEKVLAGWNGLMISTFADAGLALDAEEFVNRAVEACEFAHEELWNAESGRLARRYKDGSVGIDGYLEDYAFLGRGAFDCYQATGDPDHLAFALELARTIEAEFFDENRETLYFTPESGESLVTRPQELGDQSTPSATGVACELLCALDPFADDEFAGIVETVLATHRNRLEANPLEHVTLSLVADRLERGALELTVAADEIPREWRRRIGETSLPDRLLTRRPPTAEGLEEWLGDLGLAEAPPIWAGREAREGEPTIYACRDRTCSAPLSDVEEALEWAEGGADVGDSDGARVGDDAGADDGPENPF